MGIQADPVVVVRGDDHDRDEGRELRWTEDQSAQTWPLDLTGWTVALEVGDQSYPGVVEVASGVQKVYVELGRAQTSALAAGTHDYHLRATGPGVGGHTVSLAIGKLVAR